MNLIINFVWVGPKALGWLELFMIYTWRMYNCEVNLYTHRGRDSIHDESSLGLPPNICNVFDLQTVLHTDGQSIKLRMTEFEVIREVLNSWFGREILDWELGGKEQIFNMVDLTKSYIASTCRGVVLDLKIAPTLHLGKYVEANAFEDYFVSYVRKGTMENQCMGSMNESSELRRKYGTRFIKWLLPSQDEVMEFQRDYNTALFGKITSAHIKSLALGWKKDFMDIGKNGKKQHKDQLYISNADCIGIANEKSYGPLRIFKRESDQTNSNPSERTTPQEVIKAYRLTISEIATASLGSLVNVTEIGMPPINDLLELLRRSSPA
jgi:hypothetical protein